MLLVPDWANARSVSLNSNSSGWQFGGVRVWVNDAPGGVPFEQYNKILEPRYDGTLSMVVHWVNPASLGTDWLTAVQDLDPSDIQGRVLAAQKTKARVNVWASPANLTAFTVQGVPDYAIDMTKSEPNAARPALHATVNYYTPWGPVPTRQGLYGHLNNMCAGKWNYPNHVCNYVSISNQGFSSRYPTNGAHAPYVALTGLSNALLRTTNTSLAMSRVAQETNRQHNAQRLLSESTFPDTPPQPQGPYILSALGFMPQIRFTPFVGQTLSGPFSAVWKC